MTDDKKIRIVISDGGRHRQPTGYGKNARSLIDGLGKIPDFEVAIIDTPGDYQIEDELSEPIKLYEKVKTVKGFDCVLQVGQPMSCKKFPIPSLIFTNIDTSDMPKDWVAALSNADAVLAPNATNFELFKRYFKSVYLTQQGVPERLFKPQPQRRSEGRAKYSFIFVGTYSFRKGVDLLLPAFIQEFSASEAHLHLHIPGDQADRAANGVIEMMNAYDRVSDISLSTQSLTEQWMSRIYSRHDCFVTATRGEGWGLPIVESMLCGLPVIVPNSTGIKDYVSSDVAFPLPTKTKQVDNIDIDSFGAQFRKTYCNAGITYEEVDVDDLRKAMRSVFNNRESARYVGVKARAHILQNFSEKRFVNAVADAVRAVVWPVDPIT